MRIVNRRFAAALLALWLVLAVGLAVQAAPPDELTMTIECPVTGCVAGGVAFVSGDGLRPKNDLDLSRYWLSFDRYPGGYQRVTVNSDGSYYVTVYWGGSDAGVHELCVTYQKGNSVRTLICGTVEVLP